MPKGERDPAHPVDALKAIAARAGLALDPAAEARMRAICDEPVSREEFLARHLS